MGGNRYFDVLNAGAKSRTRVDDALRRVRCYYCVIIIALLLLLLRVGVRYSAV